VNKYLQQKEDWRYYSTQTWGLGHKERVTLQDWCEEGEEKVGDALSPLYITEISSHVSAWLCEDYVLPDAYVGCKTTVAHQKICHRTQPLSSSTTDVVSLHCYY
jgi:hypothetical protein